MCSREVDVVGGVHEPQLPDTSCAPSPQLCKRRWQKWNPGYGNSSQKQKGDSTRPGENTPRLVRLGVDVGVQKEGSVQAGYFRSFL